VTSNGGHLELLAPEEVIERKILLVRGPICHEGSVFIIHNSSFIIGIRTIDPRPHFGYIEAA